MKVAASEMRSSVLRRPLLDRVTFYAFGAICAVTAIAFVIGIAQGPGSPPIWQVCAVPFCSLGAYFIGSRGNDAVTLSEESVTVHEFGRSLEIPWESIDSVRRAGQEIAILGNTEIAPSNWPWPWPSAAKMVITPEALSQMGMTRGTRDRHARSILAKVAAHAPPGKLVQEWIANFEDGEHDECERFDEC